MGRIISYQGSMDKLVWVKELKSLSGDDEVIVPVSHEALFVLDGNIVAIFGAGRHILSEYPSIDLAEKNKFKVYYIKKEGSYNIKWAQSGLRFNDPTLNIPVEFEIEGVFAIKIIDSREFLIKQLENTPKVSLEQVKVFFRDRMLLHITDQLLLVLKENSMSIIDAMNKPLSVSKALELKMRYIFSGFGVSVEALMLKRVTLVNAFANSERDLAPILDDLDKKEGEKSAVCAACSIKIDKNANFCFNCGAKIN